MRKGPMYMLGEVVLEVKYNRVIHEIITSYLVINDGI